MEDSDENLTLLANLFRVKSSKNKQETSALWNSVTETFNLATRENYTKKQLQKRLAYQTYKSKQSGKEESESRPELTETLDLQSQILRAKKAEKLADDIGKNADEIAEKRRRIELKIASIHRENLEKSAHGIGP